MLIYYNINVVPPPKKKNNNKSYDVRTCIISCIPICIICISIEIFIWRLHAYNILSKQIAIHYIALTYPFLPLPPQVEPLSKNLSWKHAPKMHQFLKIEILWGICFLILAASISLILYGNQYLLKIFKTNYTTKSTSFHNNNIIIICL